MITDSSRELGPGYAKGFKEAVAVVILDGTNPDTPDKEVKAFTDQGLKAYGYHYDLADAEAVKMHISRIEAEVDHIYREYLEKFGIFGRDKDAETDIKRRKQTLQKERMSVLYSTGFCGI